MPAVPALSGLPLPMMVLQAISEGRSERRARAIALVTASMSWPSTRSA